MSAGPTIDFSKYAQQPAPQIDFSKYEQNAQSAAVSQWDAQQEQGHQNRMSLLAGLPGALPTVNMTPEDKESWEQGKAVGALSAPAIAGVTALGASGALAPIARRYGIKALEGAGLGVGYDLYRELKKFFEGE